MSAENPKSMEWFTSGYRQGSKFHALNPFANRYSRGLGYVLLNEGYANFKEDHDESALGMTVGRAAQDLKYIGRDRTQPENHIHVLRVFMQSTRVLHETGHLYKSKVVKKLVDRTLKTIESVEDKFTYGMCRHFYEMLQEDRKSRVGD